MLRDAARRARDDVNVAYVIAIRSDFEIVNYTAAPLAAETGTI
jgi:hypothetical protein